jgi:hypothetical protein
MRYQVAHIGCPDGMAIFRPHVLMVAGYGNILKTIWRIAPVEGESAIATGLEILMLNPDGTVQLDYQFDDPRQHLRALEFNVTKARTLASRVSGLLFS